MVTASHQARDEVLYRQYDYEETSVYVADLGADLGDATVEVVDGTAIVVVENDGDSEQYEFEVPDEGANARIKNGVLTFEVSRE